MAEINSTGQVYHLVLQPLTDSQGQYNQISLDSIVQAFRRRESPETICQNFELLRLEEAYGAIAYYLSNQADVDAYLIRQDEKWAEGKRKAEPLPANLRERLMRAREDLHISRRS